MSQPSLKRPRQNETRDRDLYFNDGNVIFSAISQGDDIAFFRVHKSLLAKQSSVFKDMFSLPSSAEMDMYDGAPLVRLHNDAKELKEFLQAIYYTLCHDTSARSAILSQMTNENLKTLLLGKERMMAWICGPAVVEMEIHSWYIPHNMEGYHRWIFCAGKYCQRPLSKAWSDLLLEVTCGGDPLAAFRAQIQKLKEFVKNYKDEGDEYYDYESYEMDVMCIHCQSRMADGLENLHGMLFHKLPVFFGLDNAVSE